MPLNLFNAIWVRSDEDRPFVYGLKRAGFDTKHAELDAQGYRLIELNTFVLVDGEEERYNAIWVRSDEDRPFVYGLKRVDFDTKQAELGAQGYRLIELNAFILVDGEGERYNAIWVKSDEDRPFVYGLKWVDFDNKEAERLANGYRLLILNTFAEACKPSGTRYNQVQQMSSHNSFDDGGDLKSCERVKSDMSTGNGELHSPGRALLSGLVAGGVLVLVVILTIFFLGWRESILGSIILWVISPLGATVAAGTTAFRQGAALEGVIALALIALFVGIFVSGFLDYVVLSTIVSPQTNPDQTAGFADVLWRRHLGVSFVTVLAGALLGMMFGKVEPRSRY